MDGGASYEGGVNVIGVADDEEPDDTGDTGIPGTASTPDLAVEVEGGLLVVLHNGVSMAPCDDLGVEATVRSDVLLVEAAYVNDDCGEATELLISWTMPAPEDAGTWTLSVGSESAEFVIESP